MDLLYSKTHLYLLIILLTTNLVGCVSVVKLDMPPPNPSPTTIEYLRASNLSPLNVGKFGIAPGVEPSMDRSLPGLRSIAYQSSYKSFSQQLREVIIAELKAACLYDDRSQFRIEAQLTESEVDAAIKTGTAKLGARFTIYSADNSVYDKALSVSSQWESSFLGESAVPAAIMQYNLLYSHLAAKLFEDADFLGILRQSPAQAMSDFNKCATLASASQPSQKLSASMVEQSEEDGRYPKKLNGEEIIAHFRNNKRLNFEQVRSEFELTIQSRGYVKRYCPTCNMKVGIGRMRIREYENLVCFNWDRVTYPSSTCFDVIQINDQQYKLVDPYDGETYIYEVE